MTEVHTPRLSRRALLSGSVAAALLQGCQASPGSPGTPSGVSTPAEKTTASLIARGSFVVAHRGSGDNWPEHTLTAYRNGLAAGADAVEISLRATSDGVLACLHDADLKRVTGTDGSVADLTFDELGELRVDARPWLGQGTELEPISRIEDVLDALPKDCLVFIEDKDGTNTDQLLDLLDAQPDAASRFIWKQWAGAGQAAAARGRGYLSWGYLTEDIFDRLEEFVPLYDCLGVPTTATDAQITAIVEAGLPVIAWEVHTRNEADRLRYLGVAGLMCSGVPYVTSTSASATTDGFATGVRAAGDLPARYADGWSSQPPLVPGEQGLVMTGSAVPRYLMGSLCPVGADEYELGFTVGWVAGTDGPGSRAGLAFGVADDGPYHPREKAVTGSYSAYLDAAGAVVLAYQAVGRDDSEPLTSIEVGALTDVEVTVRVESQRLTLTAGGRSESINHMDARGGYLWLWAEQATQGARFSGLTVTSL